MLNKLKLTIISLIIFIFSFCNLSYAQDFPNEFSLKYSGSIKNQYKTNSCLAMSLTYCLEIINNQETGRYIELSPSFIYANRDSEQYQGKGLYVSETLDNLIKYGTVEQKYFPYDYIEYPKIKAKLKEKNKDKLLELAKPYKITSWYAVYGIDNIKNELLNGNPVNITIPLIKDYKIDPQGILIHVPIREVDSRHMLCVIGYKIINDKSYWICLNSWGNKTKDGILYVPFDYPINAYVIKKE